MKTLSSDCSSLISQHLCQEHHISFCIWTITFKTCLFQSRHRPPKTSCSIYGTLLHIPTWKLKQKQNWKKAMVNHFHSVANALCENLSPHTHTHFSFPSSSSWKCFLKLWFDMAASEANFISPVAFPAGVPC